MSISTSEPREYTCQRQGCSTTYPKADAVGGYFCSAECYYKDKGAGLIEKLESDPDHCATCFRTHTSPRVNVGDLHQSCRDAYTNRTPGPICPACANRYEWFERRRPLYGENTAVDAVTAEATHQPHRPVYRPMQGCQCGTTDPGESHRFLQTEGRVVNERQRALFATLVRLADKGSIDSYPDIEASREARREDPTGWAYQAGKSVYGGEG